MVVMAVSFIVGIVIGVVILFVYRKMLNDKKRNSVQKEADRIINRAKSQSVKIEKDSKKKAADFENRARRNVESEISKQKQQIKNTKNQLRDKEQHLERHYKKKDEKFKHNMRQLEERNDRLRVSEQNTLTLEEQARREVDILQDKLANVSHMTVEKAREELKAAMEEQTRRDLSDHLTQIEKDMKAEAYKKSLRILTTAISRYASEVSTERTVSSVALTSDEMKGKIIGREGRNIRAMEAACGVDLIIDETPEAVIISSFDPVRREIARLAIEKLMEDGRVHPARIEEVVTKVKSDLFNTVKEDGEKACFDVGIHGVHPGILNLIGGLKYRHSGMQNLYKHSIEVSYIAGLIASEMGYDEKLAKRVGLLHAIGKCIDHSVEGSYAEVGADFAKRHGEKRHVVQAIRSHSGNEEPESILGHIVQAANNLAEARPGARRSTMESYIKRLADLESIGNSFDGVSRTFAIQSGKEIRVIVDSGKITDDQSQMLARDIARKIERELNYPGQIRISVIRETRIVEHAR